MSHSKLVILDRDGVINRDSDAYIKSVAEWIPYESSLRAIADLDKAGWHVAVATNQSGIGRGYYDAATLNAIHQRLLEQVRDAGGDIATIAYCPHLPTDGCLCRKPKPGLLFQIQRQLGLETLKTCWMVGDSLRDLQAGQAAECHLALVRTGNGSQTEGRLAENGIRAAVHEDLADFVDHLLGHTPA